MAVDANVLIFERTRDELRHGRSVPLAVETGFRRAFPAIRDSNISTLITCAILAFFGTDVIRGFAITLAIGVIVSFFTAITITRSLFAWVLNWRIGRDPRLYTEIHEEFAEHPPRGPLRHRQESQLVFRRIARGHHPGHPRDPVLGLQPRHRLQGRQRHRRRPRQAGHPGAGRLGHGQATSPACARRCRRRGRPATRPVTSPSPRCRRTASSWCRSRTR